MIAVTLVIERYAVSDEGEWDDSPYDTDTTDMQFTFRELWEAMQEYDETQNWPPHSSRYVLTQDEDYSNGDIIHKSLHLRDERRLRYWRKALLGRFRVQG